MLEPNLRREPIKLSPVPHVEVRVLVHSFEIEHANEIVVRCSVTFFLMPTNLKRENATRER